MKEYEIVQDPTCRTCQYFHEHYVRMGAQYLPLYYGHCCYPRVKNRYDHQVCRYWSPAPGVQEDPTRSEEPAL